MNVKARLPSLGTEMSSRSHQQQCPVGQPGIRGQLSNSLGGFRLVYIDRRAGLRGAGTLLTGLSSRLRIYEQQTAVPATADRRSIYDEFVFQMCRVTDRTST